MLVDLSRIEALLRPPGGWGEPIRLDRNDAGTPVAARGCAAGEETTRFPVVLGQPVLIDWARSIVPRGQFEGTAAPQSLVTRRPNALRLLKGALLGSAQVSRRNLLRLAQLVRAANPQARPLVLMLGAGSAGAGTQVLYESREIDQIAFDIYPTALTTFVADGHDIPLADECVDAVCVQAVLEHVLDPARVVSEIHRVLKPEGIVYAETPFMQQVHEGAYDFTRFTELGHRWLFRHFAEIERGVIGGPGLSFYWSARYLIWGLVRHRALATLLSAPFGLFALLDALVPNARRIDGANGVYFLGQKAVKRLDAATLPSSYLGAQR